MNNQNQILFFLFFFTQVSSLWAQQEKKHYSAIDFYTNRSQQIDTLYLPVDTSCELCVHIRRYIKDYRRVTNPQHIQELHDWSSEKLLKEDSIDVENCCWIPTYYRVFPEFVYVFFKNRDRYSAIDADEYIYPEQIGTSDLLYWKADKGTKIGKQIANFMPFIEMFLWQKINNETTVVCDKGQTLLLERIIIRILPSEENIFLPSYYKTITN